MRDKTQPSILKSVKDIAIGLAIGSVIVSVTVGPGVALYYNSPKFIEAKYAVGDSIDTTNNLKEARILTAWDCREPRTPRYLVRYNNEGKFESVEIFEFEIVGVKKIN
tara:strand:+ start:2384 stop:2707 length:324 start_codon:yes stop_codon:yes gene_type:complete